MWCGNRWARVNLQLVVILVLAAVAVGVSLFLARQANRNARSEQAWKDGEAAYENKDWQTAAKSYREYLGQNPDDLPILRKYAESCLSIRPRNAAAVGGAASAYRRMTELDPRDEYACEKLALLYEKVQNFNELVSFARARLERDPGDRAAPLWLAKALDRLGRPADARQTLQTFIDRLAASGGRYAEYPRACIQMSKLVAGEATARREVPVDGADAKDPPPPTALDWLDRAVAYAPDSVEVLVSRAQFLRRMAEMAGTDGQDRLSLLAKARQDLEAADAQGTDDARLLLLLGAEWLAHGDPDRAAGELVALDKAPPASIKQSFADTDDWIVARFLFALELATRRGRTVEGVSLVDDAVAGTLEKGQRARILPSAVRVYVAAGRVADARRCLDEYLSLVGDQPGSEEFHGHTAWLQALVADAENRPYTVINLLEPLVASDASSPALWRLLAEAYDRTGQPGRAAGALTHYVRLNSRDPQAVRELTRQYSKAGNWQKVLDTAVVAESVGAADLSLRLLRLEADIRLAARQRGDQRMERLQKLSAELADLRRAQSDHAGIRILQATVAETLGQAQHAEDELKLAIVECKEPLKARMQLVGYYLRTKRAKEAASVCQAACQLHGTVAEPWLALADVHAAQGDYDSACRCLEEGLRIVAEASEKRSLSIKLAMVELSRGDRATAIDRLTTLARQDAQEIEARSLLLGIREIQEDPDTARRLVEQLRLVEGDAGFWWRFRQASVWLSGTDWRARQQEIESLLRHCIEANPSWSAPVLLLAELYEKSEDYARLEDICRQGLLAAPSATDIADRLLTLLERQGRFADMQKVLQQVDQNPRFINYWKIRALLGAQDITRVIDELKPQVLNDKQDSRSRIHLARLVYQDSKDAGQALEYLKQAEAIAPDAPMLVALKASILREEGRAPEALRILNNYVERHDEFNAYWVRGAYLAEDGQLDLAEQDYKRLTDFAANGALGYELLGNFYADTERLDAGVAAIEQGLNVHPDDLRLRRRLMQLLLVRDRPEDRQEATELLDALEARLPQDVELIILRAQQMLRAPASQSFEAITKRLENAVRLEPRAVDAHLALVSIATRRADYKTACNYAIQGLVSNPNNPALLLARALAEQELGYSETAVKLAREALRMDPNSAGALDVLIQNGLAQGDRPTLDEVRVLIDAALDRRRNNEDLLISYARVMKALGTPNAAIPRLEAYCATGEGSSSIKALVTVADLHRLSGNAEKALAWIERAERLNAGNLAVVHARFRWLLSQKQFTELAQIGSRYKSADEQNLETVLQAASILLDLDTADLKREAVSLFEHAAIQWPESLDARLGLASSLYQTGDIERAEGIYRQLSQKYPDNIHILNDYAWLLQEHRQLYAEALEKVDRGLRLASEESDRMYLLDTRGAILAKMPDRLAEAREDYEELLKLSASNTPGQAAALLQLVRICGRLDDRVRLKLYRDHLLEIDRKTPVLTPQERKEVEETAQP